MLNLVINMYITLHSYTVVSSMEENVFLGSTEQQCDSFKDYTCGGVKASQFYPALKNVVHIVACEVRSN